jgi:hypothetical protein
MQPASQLAEEPTKLTSLAADTSASPNPATGIIPPPAPPPPPPALAPPPPPPALLAAAAAAEVEPVMPPRPIRGSSAIARTAPSRIDSAADSLAARGGRNDATPGVGAFAFAFATFLEVRGRSAAKQPA